MIKYVKTTITTLFFLGMGVLVGCSNTDLSEEEALKIDSAISSQISKDKVDVYEIQKTISSSIKHIKNKDISSNIINSYLYILYDEAEKYLNYLQMVSDDIKTIKKELSIDKIDVSMYKQVYKKSKVVGSILQEMHEKNLIIIDENGTYYVEVNIDFIISQYGEYINSDLVEFLKFRTRENSVEVFDANSDKYDIKEIVDRADYSIKKIEENSSSAQLENWKLTAKYYYKILLGTSIEQFLENENKTVKEEYLEELESVLNEYKDSRVYTDLNEYIELLRDNDREINSSAVSKYRENLFKNIESN